jgi:hypothetical protein
MCAFEEKLISSGRVSSSCPTGGTRCVTHAKLKVVESKIFISFSICSDLISGATPRKIVGTDWTIKMLLPEYQVCKCFIILNNCAILNSKLGP